MKINNKILIIGPIAPPLGGVSVHLSRLVNFLKDDFIFDYIDESKIIKKGYYNIREKKVTLFLKKILATDVLYIHSGPTFLKIVNIVLGKIFLKKVIVTIHSYQKKKSKFGYFCDSFFFNLADKVIVVNGLFLTRLQIKTKLYIKEAFIPPLIHTEPELPQIVNDWIQIQKQNKQVMIGGNAWRLEKFNGNDLYGLDLCIEACKLLNQKNINVSFIFIVSNVKNKTDIFWEYREKIRDYGLENKFLLLNEEISFVKLINEIDVIVRPTNTDGDALTVREAIFFNKPIVASDVVNRPKEAILFENRNLISFCEVLESTIKNKNTLSQPSSQIEYVENLLQFYENILTFK